MYVTVVIAVASSVIELKVETISNRISGCLLCVRPSLSSILFVSVIGPVPALSLIVVALISDNAQVPPDVTVSVTPLEIVSGPPAIAFSVAAMVTLVSSACSCTRKMSPALAELPTVPRSPL